MGMLIIAGCYKSGWEKVLAGFPARGDFSDYFEEIFNAAGAVDPLKIHQPLAIDSVLQERFVKLATDRQENQLIIADSRNAWLLDFWAERFPDSKFLLLYNGLGDATANAFLTGIDPQLFLDCWLATNRQFVAFQRRYRQRTLLLNVESAVQHSRMMISVLQQHGIEMGMHDLSDNFQVGELPAEGLLAGYLLAEQPEVRLLADELEASARPLGDAKTSSYPTPGELFSQYQQSKAATLETLAQLQKLETSNRQSGQESELLLLQLHQVQHELEAAFTQRQTLQTENTQLCQNHRDLESSYEDATQKNKQLLLQLQRVQEELDAVFTQRQMLQTEITRLRQSHQELESVHKDTAQKNELLLLQLYQVQEELEAVFLQKQQLELACPRTETAPPDTSNAAGNEPPASGADEPEGVSSKTTSKTRSKAGLLKKIFHTLTGANNQRGKKKKELAAQIEIIKKSGLFDEEWYLRRYEDVARSGIDPIKHYLGHGVAEGRDPSPDFDTRYYLVANRDIAASGMNPLVHYVVYGKNEGRKTKDRIQW